MSVKNSLSTLLGNYMSDTDNENEENYKSNSFSTEIGNLINEIGGETSDKKQELPRTEWAQCMDVNTGHPYYWNISTKEVTWEKPAQYEYFLNEMKKVLKKIPEDSWAIGYAEGSSTPYYLNIFTREISWQKPANFKEKKKTKKPKKRKQKFADEKETSDDVKKKYPRHLESGSEEDVKIELINSFSNKSGSSSEDEKKNRSHKQKIRHLETENQKSTKVNLVAAYATDDEEEGNLETKHSKESDKIVKQNVDSNESTQMSQNSVIKNEKPQITSFASIITGGKVETEFDDEINKLKEELEIDLVKAQKGDEIKSECNTVISNKNAIDVSFDEKNFKRKRRIEFGTTGKNAQNFDETENEDSRPSFVLTNSDDSKDIVSKDTSNSEKLLAKKKLLYSNFTKSHVEFVKSDENNESNQEINEEKLKYDKEINDLSDIILGKVKFLSVGHAEVSTVQAMRIQLETLLAAFKSSSLTLEYFFKWLKQTSDDLIKLEQNAAPDGWKCKWDRTTAQYCYENLTTNEIRWEFPATNEITTTTTDTTSAKDKNDEEVENLLNTTKIEENKSNNHDDVKGEVEMDISTTPPPNENEKIIVQHDWDADNAPPPPRITAPSPPAISTSVIINDELSAFYSDIAKINAETSEPSSSLPVTSSSEGNIIETNNLLKRTPPIELSEQQIEKKKRKKAKVSGLSMGDKGVSEMVAKWQKAQQQKGYNFW